MVEGKVQTVRGLIDPEELGYTMMHEHLLIQYKHLAKPVDKLEHLMNQEVQLSNLNLISKYWNCCEDNLELSDFKVAVKEVHAYKACGGGAIVDVTTIGIRPADPTLVRSISEDTGVHIVQGTGYYLRMAHNARGDSVESLASTMRREILEGIGGSDVKAGIIGELGCCTSMDLFEENMLTAAAIVQRETGAAISIHPGNDPLCPKNIVDVLENAGADLRRVVIGHIDRTIPIENYGLLTDLLKRGVYLEYDFFGFETSYIHARRGMFLPSDIQRVDVIKRLCEDGFEDQIVISHDIFTKHRTTAYGGHGLTHIIAHVIPEVMERRGVPRRVIRKILKDNPAKILAFSKPSPLYQRLKPKIDEWD